MGIDTVMAIVARIAKADELSAREPSNIVPFAPQPLEN
jgi:hypothetical protein